MNSLYRGAAGFARLSMWAALLVLTAACERNNGSEYPVALTLAELENATYQGFEGVIDSVTLTNGVWTGVPFEEGSSLTPRITLVGGLHRTGDLDGDGDDEAVVLLHQEMGGSGTFAYLAVLDRHDGTLRNLATELLGDRVQLRRVSIEDRQLFADVVQAGPSDAACCPGKLVSHRWTLLPDGGLTAIAAPEVTGRLALAEFGELVWVLRS